MNHEIIAALEKLRTLIKTGRKSDWAWTTAWWTHSTLMTHPDFNGVACADYWSQTVEILIDHRVESAPPGDRTDSIGDALASSGGI